MGMFYRTIRVIENGIKPCYVFDGKPPEMKSGEVCTEDSIQNNVAISNLLLSFYLIPRHYKPVSASPICEYSFGRLSK